MSEKKKIAVRTCGGCACEFNRRDVFAKLSSDFADTCEFKYSYALDKDEEFDMVLLINGCDSACAPLSETTNMLNINHENNKMASQVFAEAIGI